MTANWLAISGHQVGLSGGRDRIQSQSSPRRGPVFLPCRSSGSSWSSESPPTLSVAETWRYHLAALQSEGAAAPPHSPILSPMRRASTTRLEKLHDHVLCPSVSIKSVTLFSSPESPRFKSTLRASRPKLNIQMTPRANQTTRPPSFIRTSSRPLPAPLQHRQPPSPTTPRPLEPPRPGSADHTTHASRTEGAQRRAGLRPVSSELRHTAQFFLDPPVSPGRRREAAGPMSGHTPPSSSSFHPVPPEFSTCSPSTQSPCTPKPLTLNQGPSTPNPDL